MLTEGMATRRGDPNFAQVSGYLPVELVKAIKIACVSRGISVTDALEEGMQEWVKMQKNSPSERERAK